MANAFSQGYMRGNGDPNLDSDINNGGGKLPKLYIDDLTDFLYKFDGSKPSGAKWVRMKEDNRPYKIYEALLTQGGSNPPVANVKENTLGDITFDYDGPGQYIINSNNLFIEGKTSMILGTDTGDTISLFGFMGIKREDNSSYYLLTGSSFNNTTNNVLLNTLFIIKVYND
jgi:hypothetical protein